ncbi:MAG: FAD-dependent oxidoreductase [Bacillota bacterium]|nr:FAD-dependent oxidoreductase [Bacillota bacterium]
MDFNITIDKKVQASVDHALCINCGKCRELCPTDAIVEYQKTVSCIFSGYGDGQDQASSVTSFPESRKFALETACSAGCPLGIVPQAVAAFVKAGDLEKAYDLISEKNPLPWVCAAVCDHFCEELCKRGSLMDEALNMGALERYIVSKVSPKPYQYIRKFHRKVAVIGGGPAGLTAAFDLSRMGYDVTIFEKDGQLGGAMNWGIPGFRLNKEQLQEEIDRIVSAGIEVRYNKNVGVNTQLEELWEEGFSACLIATGASYGMKMDIPGADGAMVYDAVSVMRQLNGVDEEDASSFKLGDKVVIVGGGGAALDLAEMLTAQGKQVICTTIDGPEDLEVSPEALDAAGAKGIEFKTLVSPKQIIREGDVVKAVEFLRGEYLEDGPGSMRAHAIKGSEFNMFCDTVIFAIGQKSRTEDIVKAETYPDGKIKIDPCHRTNKNMIFACGDVTGESSSVVGAMAAGREAAVEIDNALQERKLPEKVHRMANAPDEETLYPENVPMLQPQKEKPLPQSSRDGQSGLNEKGGLNGQGDPEPVDDILPMLRSAGLEENMPKLADHVSEGRKVAIAGGGIAGITAAIALAKKGYLPTIFEKDSVLGGSYRTLATGKRIDQELLAREMAKVEEAGIPVVFNAAVGIKPSFDDLSGMGYDAVLFAIGASAGKKPDVSNADCPQVFAMPTLMNSLVNEELVDNLGKRIFITGSDEMTLDMARALRERDREVTILAPCSRGGLQVITSAVDIALAEGVDIITGVELSRINARNGRLESIDCRKTESSLAVNFPCDTLVLGDTAVPDTETIAVRNPDLQTDDKGYFVIDPQLSTSLSGVFAIGDFDMSSPDAGRAGAAAIDNYFADGGLAIAVQYREEKEVSAAYEVIEGSREKSAVNGVRLFTEKQARTEASRCMGCGYHKETAERCMGCGICMKYCPANAITMVSSESHQPEHWPNIKDLDNTMTAEAAFLSGELSVAETFAEEAE